MNLTIFIGGLSGGGAERVVCNLSNYLSNYHNVTILTMSDDKPAYNLNSNVIRVSLLRKDESNNFLLKNIKRYVRFRNYLNESSTDGFLVMLPSTINMLLCHRNLIDVPIIISERCDPYTRYENSKLRKWLMNKLYPKADGFVFQTEEAMEYYSNIVAKKGIVIPNAINQEFVRSPYTGLRDKSIVSAGRLTEQKNFTLLIEAFSKISEKYPDYDLVIYGEGAQKNRLLTYINELGLEGKVKFPGYVSDFGSCILDKSLFVLASNYEGMPNALMEAMALGLPCISTDCPVGGPKYLIKDQENGILVPIGNVDKLAKAIDSVLSNDTYSKILGDNARNIVNDLDSNVIYKKWEKYISTIISKKSLM